MDQFQENGLRKVLMRLMPERYKQFSDPEYMWGLTIGSILHILRWESFAANPEDDAEKEMYTTFIGQSKARIIEKDGEELLSKLLEVAHLYKEQCYQTTPPPHVSIKETRAYTTTENRDGYDLPVKHFYDVYRLKRCWREFLPGQVIQFNGGGKAIGGWVHSHWSVVTD